MTINRKKKKVKRKGNLLFCGLCHPSELKSSNQKKKAEKKVLLESSQRIKKK